MSITLAGEDRQRLTQEDMAAASAHPAELATTESSRRYDTWRSLEVSRDRHQSVAAAPRAGALSATRHVDLCDGRASC